MQGRFVAEHYRPAQRRIVLSPDILISQSAGQ